MKLFYQQLAITISLSFITFFSANVIAKQAMVVSEHYLASQVGADILKAGGNAIDAAVAMGYALAVVNPCCGNIGGGGFMTIHLADGRNIFLNFREKAPLAATSSMFLNKQLPLDASTKGYLAVGVPGSVLGFETALQKYGTLSRAQVMSPAIRLAEHGIVITPYMSKQFRPFTKEFKQQPNVAAIFLNHGKPYQAGDRLIQRDLAQSLKDISKNGASFFYKGPLAKTIVEASQKHGGILNLNDFANYTVEEMKTLQCSYRGYTILSAPPPSSGGVTLCEMLNILENFPLNKLTPVQQAHVIIEAMGYGFADRNSKLGDPNFVKNPIDQLLSKEYALTLSKKIKESHYTPMSAQQGARELTDTTHYSVIDAKGNAVAVTYTLNGFFGAGVIAKNTGFFLNNEMDDFATKPGVANKFGLVEDDTNAVQPNKRPLSSMTPTIGMKDGQVVLVLGSPGGPRIITAVLLTLINVIDNGNNIQDAINKPRFHYQVDPNIIAIEPHAFTPQTIKELSSMGHPTAVQHTWGAIEIIQVDAKTNNRLGANDKRRPDGRVMGK